MRTTKNYNTISDEELIIRFASNQNTNCYQVLYNRYFTQLSKYAGWLSGNMEWGKDATQNIFLKIYENPDLFDRSKKFKTWVYVVVKNKWINEQRNLNARKKHNENLVHLLADDTPTLSKGDARIEEVYEAVKCLSENHRDVFIMKYSSNLTINEIAQICACSTGTVKSRLFYAIKTLKDILIHKHNNYL